jgi:hypothetical protein
VAGTSITFYDTARDDIPEHYNFDGSLSFFSDVRGSVVVKALCCKSEGRGFKSR